MDVFLVVLFLATLVTFLLLLYYQGQLFRLLLKGLYAKHRKLVPLTVGLLAYGVGLFLKYVLDFLASEDATDLNDSFDFIFSSAVLLIIGMIVLCNFLALLLKLKIMNKGDWKRIFSEYAFLVVAGLILLYFIVGEPFQR